MTLASTRQLRLQGPVSVHTDRTEKVTGSGGRRSERGRGRDRSRGRDRRWGGNGTGTGVETCRRTQNGSGDGNGDGSENSSGDGNGDEDNGNGNEDNGNGNEDRIGESGIEAKKCKKPQNSCRRGCFNDWGGGGVDDSVPGEITKSTTSGDRTT